MYYLLLLVEELLVIFKTILGRNILRLEWSKILSCVRSETLATRAKSKSPAPSIFNANILFSKASRTLSLPSRSGHKLIRISLFFCFFSGFWGFILLLKLIILTNKLLWSTSGSFKVILPLQMSLPKVFIIRKFLKLLSSFSAFSLNVFSGIVSLIVNFWILGFKTSKTSTDFFLVLQLFFVVFLKLYQEENM